MRSTSGGRGKRKKRIVSNEAKTRSNLRRIQSFGRNIPVKTTGFVGTANDVRRGGQHLLSALGLGGAAHPIRRLQNPGGRMEIPFGRFPWNAHGMSQPFMPISRGVTPAGQKILRELLSRGGQNINDVRVPQLFARDDARSYLSAFLTRELDRSRHQNLLRLMAERQHKRRADWIILNKLRDNFRQN